MTLSRKLTAGVIREVQAVLSIQMGGRIVGLSRTMYYRVPKAASERDTAKFEMLS